MTNLLKPGKTNLHLTLKYTKFRIFYNILNRVSQMIIKLKKNKNLRF
jgi:hypothetical protein